MHQVEIYLFDEASGKMTAVLDSEMARIGDFHEDLGWVLMRIFGNYEDGLFRASLYERDEFIAACGAASGRTFDRTTLHYSTYEFVDVARSSVRRRPLPLG